MCGIFGYTGANGKNAATVLLDGLATLEYRGYDSAGLFLPEAGGIKSAGAVAALRGRVPERYEGKSGIAHLRWATHGEPTETNAHPHADCVEDVWLVHNGIVENHRELKDRLVREGHTFRSETDTEVLSHLIEHHLKNEQGFAEAVLAALREVRGTYGIAVMRKGEPDTIVAARMGAPVAVGLGEHENFVASDATPILRYTKQVIFLEDGEVAVVRPDGHVVMTLQAQKVERPPELLDWSAEEAQKGGYEHFMLKEIMEEPETIANTMRGRLIPEKGLAKLGGLESVEKKLRDIKRLIIVGCGTAYYAGLVGEYMIESQARIPVEVELGSEFRYRSPVLSKGTALLAISQSGETADTLEAIREAKRHGSLALGIVNTVGSTIARETDAGVYNHAGPEIGVASTKAFISQLTALSLLTLFLGRQREMPLSEGARIAEEIAQLPEKAARILDGADHIQRVAAKYAKFRDFLYIGRTFNYPVAYEGALKLKEISYVHAEGCGAGEMKHGPLAMIDENFPTVAIAPQDSVYEKMRSNMQEIRARKGPILAVATEGDEAIRELADDVLYIPKTLEMLTPILSVIPLQLFAYFVATGKGYDVDRPRNLAKSVTVE